MCRFAALVVCPQNCSSFCVDFTLEAAVSLGLCVAMTPLRPHRTRMWFLFFCVLKILSFH